MSLAGFVRRGPRASFYRATTGSASDGQRGVESWSLLGTIRVAALQPIAETRGGAVYGSTVVTSYVTWTEPADPAVPGAIRPTVGDGVALLTGPHIGARFRVVEVFPQLVGSASDHFKLTLQSTTEAFA